MRVGVALASGTATIAGRDVPLGVVATICTGVFAVLVLLHDVISLIGLVAWIAIIGIAIRPLLGVYSALALAMLFEAESPDPAMAFGDFLNGGLTGTSGISGAVANPFELLLLATFFSWLFQGLAHRDVAIRGGQLGWPMLGFTVALIYGFVRGAIAGGDMFLGLFESRYLFYVPICYVLAANTIRTLAQAKTIIAITVVAVGLFAIEGTYRRLVLIDGHQLNVIQEFAFQHEDVIFLGSAIVLVLGLLAFGAKGSYRLAGIVLLPLMTFAMFASQRRAGFIALLVAIVALSLVLLVAKRKAFFLLMVPMLLGTAAYMPIFWNDTGLIGQPARAVRSIWQPDARDAASNTARLLEKINVIATIKSDPLLGVGFGREYTFVVPGVDLSWWPLWRYVTHANVLWLWIKMGFLGFVAFWVLIGAAITRAVQLTKRRGPPEARAFAVLALGTVMTIFVFSYVDIGFLSGRTMILFGTILGGLAVLESLTPAAAAHRVPVVETRRLVAGIPVPDRGG